jgi:uncharacterized protein
MSIEVHDNRSERRYQLLIDGDVAGVILYRVARDAIALIHTEMSQSLEGRGLGGRLVSGALDDIRARGLRVIPICPFVRSYIRGHAEYQDLVRPDAEFGAGVNPEQEARHGTHRR